MTMPLQTVSRVMLVLMLLLVGRVAGVEQPAGVVATGTRWATPYYVVESGAPGPVVMIFGGLHGNEPAGAEAADQIRTWKLTRGKLLVLPRANLAGLTAATRTMPDEPAGQRDLNRNFPRRDGDVPRGELAEGIWELVKQTKPDWLIDLHEGYDFHQVNSDSVGSTIIHFNTEEITPIVDAMLERVNEGIEDPKRKLVALRAGGPVDGSLARAAMKRLKISSMILETTSKGQRLPVRVRQHRLMVHHLLSHLKMIEQGAHRMVSQGKSDRLRIALFDDGGVGGRGVPRLESILDKGGAVVRRIDGVDIRGGVLKQFDVAIFSGGTASGQAKALGEAGGRQMRDFVQDGGGFVGVCAGAYLATAGYDWSLKIVDARTLHQGNQWNRGRGQVEMTLTDEGRKLLGELKSPIPVLYANGPIVGPAMLDAIPDFRPLAIYKTELAENDTPKGLMVQTPAILVGAFGRGRAVAISPHPEQTDGLEGMTLRLVEWAAGR